MTGTGTTFEVFFLPYVRTAVNSCIVPVRTYDTSKYI